MILHPVKRNDVLVSVGLLCCSLFYVLISSVSNLLFLGFKLYWLCISLPLLACNNHVSWYWNKRDGLNFLRETKAFGSGKTVGKVGVKWYQDFIVEYWTIWIRRESVRQWYGILWCLLWIQNSGLVQRYDLNTIDGTRKIIFYLFVSLRMVSRFVDIWNNIVVMAYFISRVVIDTKEKERVLLFNCYNGTYLSILLK